MPVVVNAAILFQEDFENLPEFASYPWNGTISDADEVRFADRYGNGPEYGSKVLRIYNGGIRHYLPSQTGPVKIEYDFYFHGPGYVNSDGDYGAICSNGFIANEITGCIRHGTNFSVSKAGDWSVLGDGAYFSENSGITEKLIDFKFDSWYHITRTLNPENQTETIILLDKAALQEFTFVFNLTDEITSIEGITFGSGYPTNYLLVDNILVESIPEPATFGLLMIGVFLKRK